MRLVLALAVAALAPLHAPAAAAQTSLAYYCDPLHIYSYPGAPNCPVPWRPVSPLPNAATSWRALSGQPTPPSAGVNAAQPTDAYSQGETDWRSLQAWFASQSGDRLAGANFWATSRSVAGHKSCSETATDFAGDKAAFASGCLDAKARLDPIDAKRLSDPEYRAAFNNAARSAPLSAAPNPPGVASNGAGPPSPGAASAAAQGPSLQYCDPAHPYSGAPMCTATSDSAYGPTQAGQSGASTSSGNLSALNPHSLVEPIPGTALALAGVLGVLVIVAIIVARVVASVRARRKREKELCARQENVKEKIVALLYEHKRALIRRRFQTLRHDAYGNLIFEPWHKELDYFVKTVIEPAMRRIGHEEYALYQREVKPDILTLIGALIEQDAGSRQNFTLGPTLSPIDYEQYCAEQLRAAGWTANTTKASGDQGSDIIAEKDGIRLVVQCKLYNHPVGNKAVQEVAAARTHEKADYAAVVSKARYTASAQELAATNGVLLLHHADLQDVDDLLEGGSAQNVVAQPSSDVVK
jgi:hypothetical protein